MSWYPTVSMRSGTILAACVCLLLAVSLGYSDEYSDENPPPAEPPAAVSQQKAEAKADAPKAEKKAPEKKPPANPLSKLIRNIFGGPRPNPPGQLIPAEGDETSKPKGNGDTTARDHIDSRAPFDSQQASHLRKAQALMKGGQYEQAARWLQKTLDTVDDKEDSLIRVSGGKLKSVRAQANRLLGEFPSEALDGYRREYGGYARARLADARTAGDLAGIVEVADKYFHTLAGYEASNYLGTLHADRGEFGPAAQRFAQLLAADAPATRDPQWRLKAVFVFRQAGSVAPTAKLLGELAALPQGSLMVGGRDIDPADWLDGLGEVARGDAPRLDEWTMLYGTASRTGVAAGGDPLLLSRWSAPMTHHQPIAEQIEIILEDLADQNRTTVPAWFPLAVDGKVVFRTMRGVQVVDAVSGKPLWETREGVSPERVLTGQPEQSYNGDQFDLAAGINNGLLSSYRSSSVDQHPLTNLLFRNGTYGTLSSDGRQLFVIEDHAMLSRQQPGYYWGSRMNQNDPFRRDWSSNKVSAYDLSSGRPLWEVGGEETKEPFELPLAGTYFFGAPTPDRHELFTIGEKNNEIRLFSLDRETGVPTWSQLLAISEAKIEEDYGRRWWTAQVAAGNGVLVCPTTVGWLVAVDRMSHSILWAYRYSTPNRSRNNLGGRQTAVVQNSPFSQRWCPSAPVIAEGRVIFTPSEYTTPESATTSIVCLNLFDGTRLWQKPRGTFRYLAGVFDGRVVLVGTNAVTALSLAKGTTLWNRPIAEADGKPSGFGVAAGDRYYLPLSSGQLWTIDLASGRVLAMSYLPEGDAPLGNLAMYRGMLLSLSPLAMTSFEQREAILAEIGRRKQQNPHDAWALLREADIQMLNHQYASALDVFRTIPPDEVEPERAAHYRSGMIACLTEIVRSDFENRKPELEELARFVKTPAEKLHVRRLSAEQLDALGRTEEAFEVYLGLAGEDGRQVVERGGDSKVSLPLQWWLAGRLGDLWARVPQETRAKLGPRIDEAAQQVLTEDAAAQERFVLLFGFHPSARLVRNRLAERYADSGELAAAQAHLVHLSRYEDEQTAAAALLRLAEIMRKRDLISDSRFYYEHLANKYGDVEVAEGTTARQVYQELQSVGAFDSGGEADRADWGEYDLKLQRTGTNYSSSQLQELSSDSFRLPYFRQFRFQIDQQQKLSVTRVADGELYWLVPLRGKAGSSQNYPAAAAAGHRLFVLYRDVLHCLSPVERKVLWVRTLETRGQANGYYYYPNQQNMRPMQTGSSILSGQALAQINSTRGMLAVANSNYVCVYGRRTFTVIDAATGETRWTRDRVPAYTKLVGNDDVLYMIPQNRNETAAFRAADGRRLEVPNISGLLARAVRISNDGLVLVESRSASSILGLSSSSTTTVRLYDPVSKKDRWRHSFPNGAYFSILPDGSLAALRKEGSFALLDLDDGKLQELGTLDEKDVKNRSRIYVVADSDNVYLLANQGSRSGSYYSLGLPFVRVNGSVFAFDRHEGKQLWRQDVGNQNLVLPGLAHSPLLTFATRTYVRKGPLNYWTLSLVAVDKKTGKKLLDTTAPFNSSFRSVDVNLADRYVELTSYNDRIRLHAVDRPADSTE